MRPGELQREPLGSLWKVGPGWGRQGVGAVPREPDAGGACSLGQVEGPRERAVVGGLVYPALVVPGGHPGSCAQTPASTLGGASPSCGVTVGAGLGCLPQDAAPGSVASSFASPRHLGSSENQTDVSPDTLFSPRWPHVPDRVRPVLLERWGTGDPAPLWRGLLWGPGGSVGSVYVRACGVGAAHSMWKEAQRPAFGSSETPRGRRRGRWG